MNANGMDGVGSHGGPAGMDANDLFAEFFGGGMRFGFDFGGMGGPGFPKRTKGQDSVISV